jgi:mannose-6-phosphate isomerase-like protein (cupin superfamily)
MNHTTIRTAAVAGLAFVVGLAAARAPVAVSAQSPAPASTPVALPSAYVPNIQKLATKPAMCFPGAYAAGISNSSAGTVAYLVGTVAAHYHTTATEIQYVIDGSGTQVFGGKTVRFQPGTVFVIPPQTFHAGMVPDKGTHPKFLVIKVPQQQPKDNHFLKPVSTC